MQASFSYLVKKTGYCIQNLKLTICYWIHVRGTWKQKQSFLFCLFICLKKNVAFGWSYLKLMEYNFMYIVTVILLVTMPIMREKTVVAGSSLL